MAKDQMNYGQLVEAALRGVVATALRRAAEGPLPGNHHFYISFRADHPAAKVSPVLKAQHPQEMTVVLQHQYWDLEVTPEGFAVTLSFNKAHERLVVPFDALTGFYDPSVQFGLQFKGAERAAAPAGLPVPAPATVRKPPIPAGPAAGPAPAAAPENVVSLDRFRKS
jgi:hypothetical protein